MLKIELMELSSSIDVEWKKMREELRILLVLALRNWVKMMVL